VSALDRQFERRVSGNCDSRGSDSRGNPFI